MRSKYTVDDPTHTARTETLTTFRLLFVTLDFALAAFWTMAEAISEHVPCCGICNLPAFTRSTRFVASMSGSTRGELAVVIPRRMTYHLWRGHDSKRLTLSCTNDANEYL